MPGFSGPARVTRDDVARAAQVSPAVVSYVVNDGPRPVAGPTRQRVLEAIERLGYQPDARARSLRTGRSRTLGLVLPDIALPYFGEITKLLSRYAAEAGYQLFIGNSGWDIATENAEIAALAERRVDGMILMSVNPRQDFTPLSGLGIPAVVVDRPTVGLQGAEIVTRHLIEGHGHVKVAMISGAAGLVANDRRVAGWKLAMDGAGLSVRSDYFREGALGRADGYAMGVELIQLDDPPTAVFIPSDVQAMGFLRAARDLGVSVPGAIALATAEGTEAGAYAVPSLTTTTQPMELIARTAIEHALASDEPPVRRVDVPQFELTVRESCGCAAPRAM